MAELRRTIVVTGGNKGIGYGIIQNLATKPYIIIMACRSIERGNQARDAILKEHPAAQIDVLELDLDNSSSIDQFVQNLTKTYHQIDILVNNAAIAFKGDAFDINVVEQTFRTNFYGTVDLTEKVLPLIKPQGKLIFVSSGAGTYKYVIKSQDLLDKYSNPNITKTELFELAKQFYDEVKNNTYEQNGWGKSAYGFSKLNINTLAKIIVKDPTIVSKKLQVYSCCPGWTRTDMGGEEAPRSVQEGIITPLYVIELPFEVNEEFQGKFFSNSAVLPL